MAHATGNGDDPHTNSLGAFLKMQLPEGLGPPHGLQLKLISQFQQAQSDSQTTQLASGAKGLEAFARVDNSQYTH